MNKWIKYGVVLLIGSFSPTIASSSNPSNSEQFLKLCKYLADFVNLEDSSVVSQVLHTQFSTKILDNSIPTLNCKKREDPYNSITSWKTIDYLPTSDFWFKATSSASAINSQNVPFFSYSITKTTYCAGRYASEPDTTEKINFGNISGFNCITEDNLKTIVPEAKRVLATDGTIPYQYSAQVRDEQGVSIVFNYNYGDKCLQSINIIQSGYGKKVQRAYSEYNACRAKNIDPKSCSDIFH